MVKHRTLFSVVFVFILSAGLFAQSTNSEDILTKLQTQQLDQGEVVVFQDMRINELLYNHLEQNKRKEGVPGYRIRIYSNLGNTARDESQDIKARFYELFPEIPIYREYDSPYFKVYVGDYRTKIDALEDFKNIRRIFPAAFIVPDKINYPKIED